MQLWKILNLFILSFCSSACFCNASILVVVPSTTGAIAPSCDQVQEHQKKKKKKKQGADGLLFIIQVITKVSQQQNYLRYFSKHCVVNHVFFSVGPI